MNDLSRELPVLRRINYRRASERVTRLPAANDRFPEGPSKVAFRLVMQVKLNAPTAYHDREKFFYLVCLRLTQGFPINQNEVDSECA